jgi:hypothetical protein
LPLISFVFSVGVIYAVFSEKIKSIEKQLDEKKDFSERLTRIEEKTNLLIDHFIK